jgi:hypothetical protein
VGTVAYARSGVERACAEAVSGVRGLAEWLASAATSSGTSGGGGGGGEDEEKEKEKDTEEGSRARSEEVVDGPNGETVSEGEK